MRACQSFVFFGKRGLMNNEHETVIEVDNLSKTFRDFWRRPKARAVQDISFDVRRGEIFGLLGPNGSGKSTTMKLLLGLLHPSHGTISILGHSPRDVKTKARIGYLPEESYIYPYLSAEETLRFYGRLFNLPRGVREERIAQLLEMIGLQHVRRRAVGEFSKGMMRRIGLAQALINDPDLVLLDEPTSGLDPLGCRQMKDLILGLAKRGKSVILSSHLLADVEDLCDRIAILYAGKIRASGTVRQLLETDSGHRLALPELPPDQLQELLRLLREKLGSEPECTKPRINLETFFLQVIEQARSIGDDALGGAAPEEKLAGFLSADDS